MGRESRIIWISPIKGRWHEHDALLSLSSPTLLVMVPRTVRHERFFSCSASTIERRLLGGIGNGDELAIPEQRLARRLSRVVFHGLCTSSGDVERQFPFQYVAALL